MKHEKYFAYALPLTVLSVIGLFIIMRSEVDIREALPLTLVGTLSLIAVIGVVLMEKATKEEDEYNEKEKIEAFKSNKNLYYNGFIYSKKEGWSLEKERLTKNKKYVDLKDCTLEEKLTKEEN
ncbi:MAG: hypothetical protein U9N59_07120 [Campylobacterota bacterium]|nr:hypothetical protein [Campylobacterota bacterium]